MKSMRLPDIDKLPPPVDDKETKFGKRCIWCDGTGMINGALCPVCSGLLHKGSKK